jgi:2-succinyl-6-hydroxy-2,4-cyclohexadiene-1-carboxylate synthase
MDFKKQINYFQNKQLTEHPILLIHGFSSGWEEWLDVIEILGEKSSIIAVDIPGHGYSQKLEKYTIQNYSKPLISFINNNFKQPFNIIGHSLGALISIYIASKLNHLVRNLILEDPPMFQNTQNDPSIIDLLNQEAKEKIYWKNIDDAEEYIKSINPETSQNKLIIKSKNKFLTDINAYDFSNLTENLSISKLLQNIQSNTFLFLGDPKFGGILSEKDAKKISNLISKCSIKKWKNTGHGIHNEHTTEYCKIVNDFLNNNR